MRFTGNLQKQRVSGLLGGIDKEITLAIHVQLSSHGLGVGSPFLSIL